MEQPLVPILVVVANNLVRIRMTEVENGSASSVMLRR
jgi:hypothetical protein